MGRLFGPMGDTGQQDVLAGPIMEEKDKTHWDDDDLEAWVAYRTAKKVVAKREGLGGPRKKTGSVKGDGGKSNGIYPKDGERNRSHSRKSEYRPPPVSAAGWPESGDGPPLPSSFPKLDPRPPNSSIFGTSGQYAD